MAVASNYRDILQRQIFHIQKRNIDGFARFRGFTSPDPVFVFGQAGDIGVTGRLNA